MSQRPPHALLQLLLVGLLSLAAIEVSAQTYVFTDLGTLGTGLSSFATGINASGQVVG